MTSALLILIPLVMVAIDQLVLHLRGECRKPLEAICTGMLFYLFLLVPVFLFGTDNCLYMRIYYCVAVHCIVLCEGLQIFMGLQFGMVIEPTFFAMLSMTSGPEIKDFIKTIANFKLLAVVSLALALSIGSSLLEFTPCRWLGYAAAVLFLAKVIESILKRTSYHSHRQRKFIQIIQKHNALLQLVLGYVEYRQRFRRLRDASSLAPKVTVSASGVPDDLLGIIVIGESACRGHHALYGYPRSTNPELMRLKESHPKNFAVFDDAIAAIPTTPESFEFMFTCQTLDMNEFAPGFTLPYLLKKAGFWEAFYGAQPRFSQYDTSQTMIFSACDEAVNLNHATGKDKNTKRSVYDEELLGYVLPHFDLSHGKPTALFLNLYGSHQLYRNRYPEDWATPFQDDSGQGLPSGLDRQYFKEWNEYDNTVAYTDSVLAKFAAKVLDEKKRPCFMLYLSDHGEVMPDGVHLPRSRKSRDNDAYEIPLVLLWNELYEKAFPEVVAAAGRNSHCSLQMDRFLTSFCQLFGVRFQGEAWVEGVFAPGFQPHRKRKMDLGLVDYVPSR